MKDPGERKRRLCGTENRSSREKYNGGKSERRWQEKESREESYNEMRVTLRDHFMNQLDRRFSSMSTDTVTSASTRRERNVSDQLMQRPAKIYICMSGFNIHAVLCLDPPEKHMCDVDAS